MSPKHAFTVQRIEAGPWGQNCYVVSCSSSDAVVVDPGGEAGRITAYIDRNRLRVHAILATHGHHDHVGALGEMVAVYEAPFGMHAADSRILARVNLCRKVFHGLGPVDLPPIGLDLATASELRFGELELAVTHTPGHTPGSVCIEAGKNLLTGDTLMAGQTGSTEGREADPATLRESVRHLARIYPGGTEIHPGHGEPGRLEDAPRASMVQDELR